MRRSTLYAALAAIIILAATVWAVKNSSQQSAHLPASSQAANQATAASNPLQVNANPDPLSTTSSTTVQQNTPPAGTASDASSNPQQSVPENCPNGGVPVVGGGCAFIDNFPPKQ